mgnify:CR=1 FL=1
MIAYLNEFPSALPIFWEFTRFLKFSIRYVPGIRRPRVTSTLLFVAADTIQYNGKTDIKDTIHKNTYIEIFLPLVTFVTYFHLNKCQNSNQYQDKE